MIKIITFSISLIICQVLNAQSYSIEEISITLSGNASNGDFSNNTYYNALDSCNVSWEIIQDSVPNSWEYSFCFPNCFVPGIISGNSTFLPNSEQYLNCHIYPNNTSGNGVIKMEITTNGIYKDTITWNGSAVSDLITNDLVSNTKSDIKYIYDIQGKMYNSILINQIMIVEYENGLKEKVLLQ